MTAPPVGVAPTGQGPSWVAGLADLALGAALRRLDAVILPAVAAVGRALSVDGSTAPYRGMYLNRTEADRWLSLEPGDGFWSPLVSDPGQARFAAGDDGSALAGLRKTFGLTAFEVDALLVACSPDLDERYERLFGFLQDDVTRRRPTVRTVVRLAAPRRVPQWRAMECFGPWSTLVRHGLVRVIGEAADRTTLGDRVVVADEQVVGRLAGVDHLDVWLASFCELLEPAEAGRLSPGRPGRQASLVLDRVTADAAAVLAHVVGPDPAERRTLACGVSARLDRPLLVADVALLDMTRYDLVPSLTRARLAAALRGAVLLVEGLAALPAALGSAAVQALGRGTDAHGIPGPGGPVLVSTADDDTAPPVRDSLSRADAVRVDVHRPDAGERHCIWSAVLHPWADQVDADEVLDVAQAVHLDTAQILAAARAVVGEHLTTGHPRSPGSRLPRFALLTAAVRQLTVALPDTATKIWPRVGWGDLVLTPDTRERLAEVCAYARHGTRVLADWGLDDRPGGSLGLTVLFTGGSGTGKSTAGQLLASELGRPVLGVDISRLVSKYLGETEKNLDQVFSAAERTGALLIFDEADAVFGKRTAVGDSHDRYANLEVSYLLQRLDTFEGLVILTTNLPANLDPAFQRRIQFLVEFPFPDEADRERIWAVTIPAGIPRDPDVDLADLARRFPLAGGSIRNMAVAAAVLAAQEGTPLARRHLEHSALREYQKLGRTHPDLTFFRGVELT